MFIPLFKQDDFGKYDNIITYVPLTTDQREPYACPLSETRVLALIRAHGWSSQHKSALNWKKLRHASCPPCVLLLNTLQDIVVNWRNVRQLSFRESKFEAVWWRPAYAQRPRYEAALALSRFKSAVVKYATVYMNTKWLNDYITYELSTGDLVKQADFGKYDKFDILSTYASGAVRDPRGTLGVKSMCDRSYIFFWHELHAPM